MFKVFHSCYSLFVSQHKEMLLQILHDAQRYSAFRKGIAMIDICQVPVSLSDSDQLLCTIMLNLFVIRSNFLQLKNDPEEVLKWLKFSTGWSVLHNSELRIGLKVRATILHKLNMFHKMNLILSFNICTFFSQRHMDLLKEHEGNKMNPLSMPEVEWHLIWH